MTNPAIGPTLISTIISRDCRASANAWCDYLYQHIHSETRVSEVEANSWGLGELTGGKVVWLANELGEPWLRIIDAPKATQLTPFKHYGWLSLEVNVSDVDQLYSEIVDSPFEIIGEPANLDVSDDIRAMQVIGLDGEVLYLTQVKAPVPPFQLPETRCSVDRLFIPVAMVPNRAEGLSVYKSFAHTSGIEFDTKITVINRALGLNIDQKHPVATVQLAGHNLVELDQIDGLAENSSAANDEGKSTPVSGIGMVTFAVDTLPQDADDYTINEGPYAGRQACLVRGAGMEAMELIERGL